MVVGFLTAVLLIRVHGFQYVDSLPLWSKLVIAVVCCALIGAIAVYGRYRTRRV